MRATVDLDTLAANSAQLEAFRCRDFASLAAEQRALYPDAADLALVPLPIVHRVSRDLARQYVRHPVRTLLGVDEAAREPWERVWRELQIDRTMLRVQQRAVPQQAQIVTVLPHSGPIGLRLQSWSMCDCRVTFADPTEEDVRLASEVVCLVPVATTASGEVTFGRLVLTPTDAYREVGKVRTGLWTGTEDTRHPLGFVPAVGLRFTDPAAPGMWWPTVADDLLAVQIAIPLALSDVLYIARYQSHGQPVLTGDGANQAVQDMASGPSQIWHFDTMGGNGALSFDFKSPNSQIDKYLAAIDATLRYLATYSYSKEWASVASAVVTGVGVQESRRDESDEIERVSSELEACETALHQTIAAVYNSRAVSGLAVPERVRLEYRYREPAANDLQGMQALALGASLGVASAVEYVARAEGRTQADAAAVVAERLEQHRESLLARSGPAEQTPGDDVEDDGAPDQEHQPGLDALDNQVRGAL